MSDIRTRLTECFRTIFPELSNADIEAASQEKIEVWDSVATVTLLSLIEEEFGVSVSPEEMIEMDTFQKSVEVLESKTAGR